MKIPIGSLLLFLSSGAGTVKLLLPNRKFYVGENPEIREIRFKFHQEFPRTSVIDNGYVEWIRNYGKLTGFPHIQKLILDLSKNFPISDIQKDSKVLELIRSFYEGIIKEDKVTLLRAFHIKTTVATDLVERGFPINEYSLDELLVMFLYAGTKKFDFSQFAIDRKFAELISGYPKIMSYFTSYGRMKKIHKLLVKERKPVNLIMDILGTKVKDLESFSELPIMVDDSTRSILLSIFQQESYYIDGMLNTLRRLSKYPNAIKCLELAREPGRTQKRQSIILFPHRVPQESCDDIIISFDLQKSVGGWRQEAYEGHDYFAVVNWGNLVGVHFLDKFMMIEDNDIRDRMILDWLWIFTYREGQHLFSTFMTKAPKVLKSIVNEESQRFIYQMFEIIPPNPHDIENYENDDLIPELEEEHWNDYVGFPRRVGNVGADLLQFLVIPRLFPNRASRIALSLQLDTSLYTCKSKRLYIDSILDEYLSNNDQAELKKCIIESLQETFKIEIDPLILDDLICTDFEEFATAAYEKIRNANIRFIEFEKLFNLAQEQERSLPKRAILEEIISRASLIYPEGEYQSRCIRELTFINYEHEISFNKSRRIKDVRDYLNFLYQLVEPISFFRNALSQLEARDKKILLSALRQTANSNSFGYNFLNDLRDILSAVAESRT